MNRINPTSVDSFVGAGPTESSAAALVRNSFSLRGDWGAPSRACPPFLNIPAPVLRFGRAGRQESCWGWAAAAHMLLLLQSMQGLGQQHHDCW